MTSQAAHGLGGAVDAATCVASGVLMTLGSAPIAGLTAIPSALLLYAGFSLFPIAAFMARRRRGRSSRAWRSGWSSTAMFSGSPAASG